MEAKPLLTQGDLGQQVEYLRPLNEQEMRFCLYLAVGDSIAQAGRRVGIARSTAYEWAEKETVKLAVAGLTLEAATRARRRLASAVNRAVRNLIRLSEPGGASHKGAPTELEANKVILATAHLDELPVLSGQRRIVTYVPAPGRSEPIEAPDDQTQGLALPAQTALPVVQTPDGLPPDLPRTAREAASSPRSNAGYAEPVQVVDTAALSDPAYWGQRR